LKTFDSLTFQEERLLWYELPVAKVDRPTHLHLHALVLRQGDAQVYGALLQVYQVEVDTLMEVTPIEGKMELAW